MFSVIFPFQLLQLDGFLSHKLWQDYSYVGCENISCYIHV